MIDFVVKLSTNALFILSKFHFHKVDNFAKIKEGKDMKLQRFKERDNKRIGIIVFTVACILLVSGVILYRTFAIFEVKTNQNIINGQVQSMGDLEFVFYKDDVITKNVPTEKDYAFDSSKME